MLRFSALVISVVFHPLLMLTYMLLLMLIANPYMFGYSAIAEADTLILMVFLTSALVPLIAIFVMKGIGWVQSLQMSDRHERIGPYIVTAVLYLTLYLHLSHARVFPDALLIAALGSVIALFCGFFVNNFRKVSMHAIAAGGLLGLTGVLYSRYSTDLFILPWPDRVGIQIPTIYLLYCVIIVVGAVCTARLIGKNHVPAEVYAGLFIGLLSMVIAIAIRG
jgi:hypothetical protein